MTYKILYLSEHPEVKEEIEHLSQLVWPPFMFHGQRTHRSTLYEKFPEYQLVLHNEDGTPVGAGQSLPYTWKGTLEDLPTNLDQVVNQSLENLGTEVTPTHLCALYTVVHPDCRGKGLSSQIIEEMRRQASQLGSGTLLAPVRPILKSLYPLTKIEKYIEWKSDLDQPFDPWIRTHTKHSGRFLQVIPQALTVTGTVAEWEEWAGIAFPESGFYIVPDALQPVEIDRERDLGRYYDPNVWMEHPVGDEGN